MLVNVKVFMVEFFVIYMMLKSLLSSFLLSSLPFLKFVVFEFFRHGGDSLSWKSWRIS